MATIEIPTTVGFREKKFEIAHAQQLSPQGSAGFIQTINRTSPFWVAEYTTPPMTPNMEDDCRSFLDFLDGSMNTFLAYDPRRIMPRFYLNQNPSSNPWGVAPVITAQNYAASTINLSAMTNGAIITKGDYISVQVGIIWYLFRALQTRIVTGGGVSDLAVRPRPNIINFVGSAIRYKYACIEMKMIGEPEWSDAVDTLPSVKFRAAQFTARAPLPDGTPTPTPDPTPTPTPGTPGLLDFHIPEQSGLWALLDDF